MILAGERRVEGIFSADPDLVIDDGMIGGRFGMIVAGVLKGGDFIQQARDKVTRDIGIVPADKDQRFRRIGSLAERAG